METSVRTRKIAAIVPALDEEHTIASVVVTLRRSVDLVIVADNGSRDRTADLATLAGASIAHEPRRGYGAACLAGMAALPADTDTVVFVDGDGSDELEDLAALIAPILAGEADLVIGSRVRRALPGALTLPQRAGNWLACRLLAAWYGQRASDLGPFRAIRASALRNLGMRDRGFGWTVEMQARAARANLRVREIHTGYRKRRAGRSKVAGNMIGSVKAGATILWQLARLRVVLR